MRYQTPQDLLFGSFKNKKFSNRICIEDDVSKTKFTYRDMDHETALAASLFKNFYINPGNTVSLLLENGSHFFIPWLGAMRLGAVVHPINCLYRHEQVLYALKLCETKLLVMQERYAWDSRTNSPSQTLIKIRERFPSLKILVMHDPENSGKELERGVSSQYDTNSWSRLIKFMPRYEHISFKGASDPFQLICTSGTTGMPKAVVQHCGMFEPNVRDLIKTYSFSENDRSLLINRLFHVNAQVTNFFPMALLGGTTILASNGPEKFLENLGRLNITYSSAIPPYLKYILSHPIGARKDRDKMRFVIAGADILSPELHRKFTELTGISVRPGYGLTETLCWCTGSAMDEPIYWGSVGNALPHNEIKIVDPENNWEESNSGAWGRLIVKGDNVFRGYFKDSEATKKAFTPSERWGDGWFDTGDTCRRPYKNKSIVFFGWRSSADSWKVRGEFVQGPDIDNYASTNPEVNDAMAVPVTLNGETETFLCAVLKPDHAEPDANLPGSITELGLMQYLEKGRLDGKLEKHCKIKGILFVKNIELGDTGKKSRKKMAAIAQELIENRNFDKTSMVY